MLVGGVVGHDVEQHPQPERRAPRAISASASASVPNARLDVAVVGDVVAGVGHRRRVPRVDPHRVDAEVGQVGQPARGSRRCRRSRRRRRRRSCGCRPGRSPRCATRARRRRRRAGTGARVIRRSRRHHGRVPAAAPHRPLGHGAGRSGRLGDHRRRGDLPRRPGQHGRRSRTRSPPPCPTSRSACSDRNQRCSSTSWKTSAGASRPARSGGIGVDDRLVDLGQPPVGGVALGHRAAALLLQPARGRLRMSLSSRRAWCSCTSSPVSRNSSRRCWPGSATRVCTRSRAPSADGDQLDLADVEARGR